MQIQIFLSLVIALVGAALYLFSSSARPKLAEIGRLSFAVGLLAFLMQFGPYVVGK